MTPTWAWIAIDDGIGILAMLGFGDSSFGFTGGTKPSRVEK